MSRTARLYIGLAIVAVGLDLAGLVLYWSSWPEILRTVERPLSLLETPEPLVASFAVAGLVIAVRRPDNPIGRLLITIGFFSGLFVFSTGYTIYAALAVTLPGSELACWVGTWAWFPTFGLLTSRLMLVYPDGRLPSPRWRWAAWMGMTAVVAGTLGAATQPVGGSQPVPVACATPPLIISAPVFEVALTTVMLLGLVAMVALARKAVVGGPLIRAQLKWFALASGLLVLAVLGREATPDGSTLHSVLVALVMVAALAVPAAIGVAILRHRLYDIDRLVSRTVTYGVLTATLVVGYLGLVFVLRDLLPFAGDLPVAISTLAVAAAFAPLRRWIQRAVDQRFNRSRYDSERVTDRLGRVLRGQSAVNHIGGGLQEVVAATLQPSHVSIWLRRRATTSDPAAWVDDHPPARSDGEP